MKARRCLLLAAAAVVGLGAGCGGGSGGPPAPKIAPARQYEAVGFRPSRPVRAGRATRISFRIVLPSGATLTHYRTGAGPHTGVDLVIVRQGADAVVYTDTKVARNGVASEDVVLPAPGRYRVVIDAYPNQSGVPRNFQLFKTITATGTGPPPSLPVGRSSVAVGDYRFTIQGKPRLKAIQPTLMTIAVTDSHGRPAALEPYEEALAHAIFIRVHGLDYFHTHVCAPSLPGCTRLAGGPPVGAPVGAGRLRLGALLPLPGAWRLFLLAAPNGHATTAPLTLHVGS